MATFLISHGAWGGGWEWTPVATRLRDLGHRVHTPTLTGLGERSHRGGKHVTLSDHIDDLLAVCKFEQLDDLILCGHSYSGMVVTSLADRIPERIATLVYLDAFVPTDGQSLEDLTPPAFMEALRQSAAAQSDNRCPLPDPMLPPEGVIPDAVRSRYIERIRPQPIDTFTEPARLVGNTDELPRAYVRCTADANEDILGPFAARARAEEWLYRELNTAHDLQLLDPDGTAAILDELATASPVHSTRTATMT